MKKKTNRRGIGAWLLIIVLCVLGVLVRQTPGFSFSGYLIWLLAGILLTFRILHLLGGTFPKLAKFLRILLILGLCAGFVLAVITGCFIAKAGKGDDQTRCEYMIVLGAGVNGTQPSMILSQRINCAYDYLIANPDAVCIASGGQGPGEDITEAQCIYDRLTQMGIDGKRIWLEENSTSTRENLQFSMELIREKTGSRPAKAAIISNEFHLYRAGLFASEQGLEAVCVPAETTWVSLRINYFLREIVAVWYYWVLGG